MRIFPGRRTGDRAPGASSRLGFSAAEMAVVVALIGIMVLITTPALLNFYNSMKVRTGAHRLMSHLRLCRQVAVSRRAEVIMELQRSEGSTQPTYRAWVDLNGDGLRTNAADAWVVTANKELAAERITFLDTYNDTTPSDPSDDPGSSVMGGGGVMKLRFMPNGQVMRVATDNTNVQTDVQLRMRLQRAISNVRTDRHDVTVNRAGKVDSDFTRVSS